MPDGMGVELLPGGAAWSEWLVGCGPGFPMLASAPFDPPAAE